MISDPLAPSIDVSVLMTVYNAAEYLQQALDSVFAQTFLNWELIVSDDGSTDPRVKKTLHNYAHNDQVIIHRYHPSITERRKEVRYAKNLNLAAIESTGRYLTFLCGDDFYYPERLERMVRKMSDGAHVVYGSQRLINEEEEQFGFRLADMVQFNGYHRVDLNSVMLTREAFFAVGGFPTDPWMWRDADAHLWTKLGEAKYPMIPVDDPMIPTDCKRYRADSVDMRVRKGLTPW